MKEFALALGGGMFVGVLFAWMKLPLPAPPTLIGLAGAFGIYLGSALLNHLAA
jgi:XapX domain-containing protein